MKYAFVLIALAFASSAFADQYTGGPCSVNQLMHAIHQKCGADVQWTNGEITYYQGDVYQRGKNPTSTYQIPVAQGDKEITVRSDLSQCSSLRVVSECPSN